MPSTAPERCFPFREYLELEEASNTKHEYVSGEIFAMAGGSPTHAALSMTIGAALVTRLRGGPCRVYSSDLRIRVPATGLATYPDVSVVCGDPRFDADSDTTVINPKLIVEVLSPSTELYDRGEKLAHYKQLEGLTDCLLVAQDRRQVEHWSLVDRQWTCRTLESTDSERLHLLGIELGLDEIYEGL